MIRKRKQSSKSTDGTALTPKESSMPVSAGIGEAGPEPRANRVAVPVFFIVLLGAILFWGDMYLVNHGGELDARVYAPYRSVDELASYLPKGEADLLKAQGMKVYTLYCVACHQNDGNGSAAQFVPPLAGSEWVSPKDPGRIIRVVLNGLQGPVTVSGKQFGQVAMLPWRDALNDQDVAAVLTYVRNSWGNKAPPVSPDDVKKIREETRGRAGSWTADELLQIPLKD